MCRAELDDRDRECRDSAEEDWNEEHIPAFLWSVGPGRLPSTNPHLQKLKYNIAT